MSDDIRLRLPFALGHLDEPDGPVLYLNAIHGPALSDFDRTALVCEQGFLPDLARLRQAGLQAEPEISGTFGCILLRIHRNRAQTLATMARAWDMLRDGGLLLVSGARDDGIEGIRDRLRKITTLDGTESKAHGKVLWLRKSAPLPMEQWRADGELRPNASGMLSAPGMFSWEDDDPGSVMLADMLAGKLKGRVADLGAGYGTLSSAILKSNPAITEMTLVEADFASFKAAKHNIDDPRATCLWGDATAYHPDTKFNHVITNPPFHTSRRADPRLGQAFLQAAAGMLLTGGHCYIVANRQLPYEATLETKFVEWTELGGTPRYKLLVAKRPKKR